MLARPHHPLDGARLAEADMTKADLVQLGEELGTPLGMTWSCYAGMDNHCGKCGTCVERKEAFELAKVPDPTKYIG